MHEFGGGRMHGFGGGGRMHGFGGGQDAWVWGGGMQVHLPKPNNYMERVGRDPGTMQIDRL